MTSMWLMSVIEALVIQQHLSLFSPNSNPSRKWSSVITRLTVKLWYLVYNFWQAAGDVIHDTWCPYVASSNYTKKSLCLVSSIKEKRQLHILESREKRRHEGSRLPRTAKKVSAGDVEQTLGEMGVEMDTQDNKVNSSVEEFLGVCSVKLCAGFKGTVMLFLWWNCYSFPW